MTDRPTVRRRKFAHRAFLEPEQAEQIARRVLDGVMHTRSSRAVVVELVAKEFGTSVETVEDITREFEANGGKLTRKSRLRGDFIARVPDQAIADARADYARGVSRSELAARLGVCEQYIGKLLASQRRTKAGPVFKPLPSQSKLTDEQVAEIRARWHANTGERGLELAKAFGVDRSYIYRLIRGEKRKKPTPAPTPLPAPSFLPPPATPKSRTDDYWAALGASPPTAQHVQPTTAPEPSKASVWDAADAWGRRTR